MEPANDNFEVYVRVLSYDAPPRVCIEVHPGICFKTNPVDLLIALQRGFLRNLYLRKPLPKFLEPTGSLPYDACRVVVFAPPDYTSERFEQIVYNCLELHTTAVRVKVEVYQRPASIMSAQ